MNNLTEKCNSIKKKTVTAVIHSAVDIWPYHSPNMFEYARVLSDTGDMKYRGTVLSPQLSR